MGRGGGVGAVVYRANIRLVLVCRSIVMGRPPSAKIAKTYQCLVTVIGTSIIIIIMS